MSKSFFEKINTASKIKVKVTGNPSYKNSGFVTLPASAVRQAKEMAIRLVCMEKNCTKKDIEKNPTKFDGLLEGAFKGVLEGYAESMIPASNPGRHRARAVVDTFSDFLMSENGGYWKKAHPSDSKEKIRERSLIFKSGLMKISDSFLEGTLGINAKTIGEGEEIPQEDIGMNFADGMKKGNVRAAVVNRYYQLTTVAMAIALLEKMFQVNKDAMNKFMIDNLGEKKLGELTDANAADAWATQMKIKFRNFLSTLNLNDSLK